jgi:FkbM family methyltransferase
MVLLLAGQHEPALQDFLSSLGRGDIRGWVCWDLGAHFGLYSIGFARRVWPTGQVAAFEPNPRSFARLARHARTNRLPWLQLFRAAASDKAGHSELYTYGDLGSTTTHLPYEGEIRTEAARAIPVETVVLDELVSQGTLRQPQVVKIDVEGHAHHALRGMQRSLSTARPLVIVGLHSPQEIAGVRSVLEPLDLTAQEIGAPPAPDAPLRIGADYAFTPRC